MSKLFKKFFTIATVAVVAVGVAIPASVAQGATVDELQAMINSLLQQIAALQSQVQQQTGGSTGGISGIPAGFTFNTNLQMGATGTDVKYLQIVLNSDAATRVASTGAGSPGNETTYFGPATKAGVVKLQNKYTSEVLAPWGLSAGTGYVGNSTRAKLNALVAAGTTVTPTPTPTPTTTTSPTPTPTTTPVEGNTLQVTLGSDTPASANVARSANANFTKLVLTAGNSEVSVSSLYVTRYGLSANASVENLKIVDEGGVKVGSIGTLNTNSKAQITFSPALKVAANTTKVLFIRAGISSTANAGETVVLGIDSASDISAGSATVSGNFPAKGNAMSAVVLTIGSVEVIEDGALVDSQPDVGDTDVPVNAFKVVVGSTEGVTVEQITVEESGSASLSDTKNVELYDVTKGVSLGTTQWTSDGKASWSGLNISLAKGETRRFKVMLDVIGGTGLTVNADLMDGSDVLMSVKGNTYGFYISPDGNDASDWTNSNDGLAANNQTIQSGSLTITKSNKSPATGNIAPANNQALAAFDFVVAGESVKVTSLQFSFDLTSGFVDGTDEGQITNVKLYDASGNLVAGPQDLSATNDTANSTTYEATVTFTDVLIIPVGTNVYTVKADIATTTSTGDALVVGVGDADSETTVVGMTSNNTITANPTASNVNGNTQTVAAGALTATTLTAPAARSIAAGSQDFIFMTGSLAATTSGEDVQATAVTIQNDPGSGTGADDVVNVEIWADLTSANSSRGDKYETKVTTTTSFDSTADDTADTIAFTLNPVITVKKGLFVDIAVVADLRTSADVTGVVTHTLDIDAVTASGASTGATVDVTPTGSGQAMTATTGGTLTVTVDASNPSAKLVLSGGSKEAVGVFRLAADNVEDLDLDSVLVTATGSQTDTIAAYYLYSDKRADGGSTSDPISVAPGGTTANFQIADGTVTIPANGYARLTVKADTQSIDGTAVQNADTVQVSIVTAGDVDTTGKASGGAVDSTETNVEGSIHKLYKAYPKFTVSSDTGKVSPATGSHLNGGSKQLVAIFKVEAVGGDDVTFQNADGNLVIFQITVTGDDDAGTETITFEDQDANTLDTGTITSASATTEITVDFSSNDLTVPMGEAKYIYVYADTSDLETDGNTLQVWLDNTAGDIDFGVNGANFTNSEGAIIFKGDILAGSLVNPS